MLQRLYQRIMELAEHRHAFAAVFAVAFLESWILPIPPEAVLIPTIIAAPKRAFRLAGLATIGSVLGGFIGYAIGYFAFAAIVEPLLHYAGEMDRYDAIKTFLDHWGVWGILIQSVTLVPYTLITVASGVFKFDIVVFGIASLLSRAFRFFLIATLLYFYGEPIRRFVEKRLTLVTSAGAAAVIGGLVAVHYLT
jgi:membrane protein YqaA with SNARE-associated domain